MWVVVGGCLININDVLMVSGVDGVDGVQWELMVLGDCDGCFGKYLNISF